jgi:DNA-binding MarR family transcriptional regulator
MRIDSLKPCPYRDSRLGYLLCKVSDGGLPGLDIYSKTNLTTYKICQECKIPEIAQYVNCLNLDIGKIHKAILVEDSENLSELSFLGRIKIDINCSAVGFDRPEAYQVKCSSNCPSFRPIYKDISHEEQISIDNFDASTATDRALRQAVLAILYQYHARHPERFDCFDVTPDFIGKCLGITVQDVVRVVAPMEEEGEVTTKRYAHDIHFRYVTIRSKGIRMIDEEPLFERFNTAQVRSEMNFYAPSYGATGNVEGNQQILEKNQVE